MILRSDRRDMAVQLRRYEVEKGGLGRLVEWFPTIAAVRDQYGFTIEGAYADEENSEFVWIVSYPGDVDTFESACVSDNESPARAAAFDGFDCPRSTRNLCYVNSAL